VRQTQLLGSISKDGYSKSNWSVCRNFSISKILFRAKQKRLDNQSQGIRTSDWGAKP